MSILHPDVVIVGAGPAGATLALLLVKSGISVTLVEQEAVLDREFRGPAYQPSAVRIWDEMGIKEDLFRLDHHTFASFAIQEGNRVLTEFRFDELPPPYNYVVMLKQASLLKELITLAGQYPHFHYLGGSKAVSLLKEESGIQGIIIDVNGEEKIVRSRLVVACDGRFSRLRQMAGIEQISLKQGFDLLWYEIPSGGVTEYELTFRISRYGLLVQLPIEGGKGQIGWLLPKGAYPEIRKRGIEAFIEGIAPIDEKIYQATKTHINSWQQCSLLDVKMGMAKEWARNGLLLLGDAAHIASPIGALGNKLAIEDATLAHPHIVRALRNRPDCVQADDLHEFITKRRPDIEENLHIQRRMGRLFFENRSFWMLRFAAFFLPLVLKTPIGKHIRKTIALSPHAVHVDSSFFQDPPQRYYPLTVEAVHQETPDTRSIQFSLPANLRDRFTYSPGQFITLRLFHRGKLLKRCYSLSSTPKDPFLQVTVKKDPKGLISPFLEEEIAVGDRILVLPPAGEFIALPSPSIHYLFLAGAEIRKAHLLCTCLLHSHLEIASQN